jgi:hypothetical protein
MTLLILQLQMDESLGLAMGCGAGRRHPPPQFDDCRSAMVSGIIDVLQPNRR